jgi:hypothetical protein
VVEKNPSLIIEIKNPSEKVQLVAVKKDSRVIRHIKKPTEKVKQFLRSKGFNI